MTILDIIGGDTQLQRVSTSNGGEYAGACPSCAGEDRFRVWPESGRYWCRGCNAKGDSIEYLRRFRGYSFADAAKAVGKELDSATPRADKPIFVAARAILALESEFADCDVALAFARAKLKQMGNLPDLSSDEEKVSTLKQFLLLIEREDHLGGIEAEMREYIDGLI